MSVDQPAAQPVAWRITKGGNTWLELHEVFESRSYDYGQFEPLYTRPDPRIVELEAALRGLLADTQHKDHYCGDEDCPVAVAKAALKER